ncbi:MAG: cupin domain-containing protein [Bacteroidota bacterium]
MPFIDVEKVDEREVVPGFRAVFAHSANMTLACWTIDEGAILLAHSHPHEQISHVVEGRLEMTLDGETRLLDPGAIAVIPAGLVHSGKALTRVRAIDAFYPVREDYR